MNTACNPPLQPTVFPLLGCALSVKRVSVATTQNSQICCGDKLSAQLSAHPCALSSAKPPWVGPLALLSAQLCALSARKVFRHYPRYVLHLERANP